MKLHALKNMKMIFEYCHKAIKKAEYEKLEDGRGLAKIPRLIAPHTQMSQ